MKMNTGNSKLILAPLNLRGIRFYIKIIKNYDRNYEDEYIGVYCRYLISYINAWENTLKYSYGRDERKMMNDLLNDEELKRLLLEYLLKQ